MRAAVKQNCLEIIWNKSGWWLPREHTNEASQASRPRAEGQLPPRATSLGSSTLAGAMWVAVAINWSRLRPDTLKAQSASFLELRNFNRKLSLPEPQFLLHAFPLP